MELRHLRYFIAVAEAGSLTVAAERKLHTAQPSLSRQIRDLEIEIGTELITRSSRGVELTVAGKVFLDHARHALAQVEAAKQAARRAGLPAKRTFALGFLSGCEPEWLPAAMDVLREKCPDVNVSIVSKHSPQLADGLAAGRLDAAFLRPEQNFPELAYQVLVREPLVVMLPSDHRLASHEAISPRDLAGEAFIGMADQAPVLSSITESYIRRSGIDLNTALKAEYLSMAMSLVASTRAVTLLPDFARNYLTWSVISRPLAGEAPLIDLVLGHHRANNSPLLRLFLSRTQELASRVAERDHAGR
ncbi:MAG TPA: LysR substrate-binding domain-containing protein [Acetobacteraceae bacterium]|jgi:LysR family hca operon transcriptional activator